MNNNKTCYRYTGIGARKSGNHTKSQFLAVMNKDSESCAAYYKSLRCKSCKTKKDMSKKLIQKYSKKTSYNISKQFNDKINKVNAKCDKCKKNYTKKCSLKKYIQYSGAVPSKCSW